MSAYYLAGCLRIPTTHFWRELNPTFLLICSKTVAPERDLPLLLTDPEVHLFSNS